MTTIDNIMALAEQYASQWENSYEWDKANTALRTALTEALAQQRQTPGCTSNCDNCTYAHGSPAHAGYCYAFYEEPKGVCAQWKDASLINEGTKAQPVREPVAMEDAESLLQDVAAYIGVGGYNGATPKQLSERICAEFERLNNKAQTAQPIEPTHYLDAMGLCYTAERAKFIGIDVAAMVALYAAPQVAQPVREPLNKSEWPKHPSAYVNNEYMGYSKLDLDSYAMQVLAAHGIVGEQ